MRRSEQQPVEVRSTYRSGHWSSGFEVAEVVRRHHGEYFRLRRRSDGAVLPALFSAEDVRRARPRGP